MYCPNCGMIIKIDKVFSNIGYSVCENCKHEFTIKDYGIVELKNNVNNKNKNKKLSF